MFKKFTLLICALVAATVLNGCTNSGLGEQALQKIGVLRVAIVNDSHVYFDNQRVQGFEYDLVTKYAQALDVRLEPTFVNSQQEVSELIESGRAHLGIGMLPVTGTVDSLAYGPSISTTNFIVVSHTDAPKMSSVTDLETVSTVATHDTVKLDPFDDGPVRFRPTVLPSADADALLSLVEQDRFDAAIITEADFELLKRKYPYLKKRFVLRENVPVAWMMAKSAAPELRRSLSAFITSESDSGYLAKRWEFHYQHLGGFDFVDARKFMRRYSAVLPKYRDEFKKAAAEHNFDWRLLAALSYQESHWDPGAVSPTGVKGLMMLTRNTAKELGVVRTNPVESIQGGTRYLATLQSRLDERIAEEEQALMALAAYNVGLGHLRDAQRVARFRNKNDSEWQIVKAHLPLLNKQKYAKHTRYGRARGGQAVHYVEGVRRYYAIMRMLEPAKQLTERQEPAEPILSAQASAVL